MMLLGRTPYRWFQLLSFYIIYYVFLACLFYFFIVKYKNSLPVPGNTKPYLQSRLDTPGMAVYPFNSIHGDGDNSLMELSNTEIKKEYIKEWNKFVSKYKNLPNLVNCKGADVETKSCNVPNIETAIKINITTELENQTPHVILGINKIYGWKPVTTTIKSFGTRPEKFIRDSVYFGCYESDSSGIPIKDGKFKLEFVGADDGIKKEHFPYLGMDKLVENPVVYNKPFTILKISSDGGFGDGEMHTFRCNAVADNIDYPAVGDGLNDDTSGWSRDLDKLTLGYFQFGFRF